MICERIPALHSGLFDVAFSLFGKKPAPAPLGGKGSARPAAKPVAKPAVTPAAGRRDEAVALDFTQPGDIPKRSSTRIEVQETSHQIPAAIEQSAVLFSAEQPEAACAPLEGAIRADDLGPHARRAWGMLFELYQLLGRQADFEQLAVEFAARFETSPPAWTAVGESGGEAKVSPGGTPTVALASLRGDKVQEAVVQLFRNAEKCAAVRLGLAKAADFDEDGCALLNEALRQLKRTGKECALPGADKAVALLAPVAVVGTRDKEQAWLLLLEFYQHLGDQEAFDEAAVNYAITFEVSPPSWESGRAAEEAGPADAASALAPEADAAACRLEGDIVSGMDDAFDAIDERAGAEPVLAVDVSRVRRMDFVAAANLMNLVTRLSATGQRVRFVGASHLLAALWEIIGLDRVAGIELRKA